MILFFLIPAAIAQTFTTVDVQSIPATGDPQAAVITVTAPAKPREIRCDILIAGATNGGVPAALEAARRRRAHELEREDGRPQHPEADEECGDAEGLTSR